ncbi:hypothetical protein L1887_32366 [Cichorium endivia]|nr:hypothetical protein L1887_32366 [Cichorium endivia]
MIHDSPTPPQEEHNRESKFKGEEEDHRLLLISQSPLALSTDSNLNKDYTSNLLLNSISICTSCSWYCDAKSQDFGGAYYKPDESLNPQITVRNIGGGKYQFFLQSLKL